MDKDYLKRILYQDCSVYGKKIKHVEAKFISDKSLIKALKFIFKENKFWGIAFQVTTWLNQEIDQPIPLLCPCGKINKEWSTKNSIVDDIENNGKPIISKINFHSLITNVKELNKIA